MEFFAQAAFHSNLFRDDVTTHPEWDEWDFLDAKATARDSEIRVYH